MRRITGTSMTLLTLLVLFCSCRPELIEAPIGGEISIDLYLEREGKEPQALEPGGDIHRLELSGRGPGDTRFSLNTTEGTVDLRALPVGKWEFRVLAYSVQD
ncbi:MAG TPA: hypothetical protein ENN41_00310, partial [Sediminispirochaeta sp.]|nr:hypothetical protein [Sediminispirochaeta sp.]